MLVKNKRRPGQVRDAIIEVLMANPTGAVLETIQSEVTERIGQVPASSIRSYLRLNTPGMFARSDRGQYVLDYRESPQPPPPPIRNQPVKASFRFRESILINADCCEWLSNREPLSIHAVVTDPPYGLFEYSQEQQEKLRSGKGGHSPFVRWIHARTTATIHRAYAE